MPETFDTARKLDFIARPTAEEKRVARNNVRAYMTEAGHAEDAIEETIAMLGLAEHNEVLANRKKEQ